MAIRIIICICVTLFCMQTNANHPGLLRGVFRAPRNFGAPAIAPQIFLAIRSTAELIWIGLVSVVSNCATIFQQILTILWMNGCLRVFGFNFLQLKFFYNWCYSNNTGIYKSAMHDATSSGNGFLNPAVQLFCTRIRLEISRHFDHKLSGPNACQDS